jgi:hypothetical protein
MNTTTHTPTLDIKLTNGESAKVAIIYPDQPYGHSAINTSGRVMIEFRLYWICGQYYLGTIMKGGYHGLCVEGSNPNGSSVSAETMEEVKTWIMETI